MNIVKQVSDIFQDIHFLFFFDFSKKNSYEEQRISCIIVKRLVVKKFAHLNRWVRFEKPEITGGAA